MSSQKAFLLQKALPLQMDSGHCRAICDEIGDRLRILLDRETGEMPQRLRLLMERLAERDGVRAPSIVPAMDDIIVWTNAA
jgi:transposase